MDDVNAPDNHHYAFLGMVIAWDKYITPLNELKVRCWKYRRQADDLYFIAGITKTKYDFNADIPSTTYHFGYSIPMQMWKLFDVIEMASLPVLDEDGLRKFTEGR